MSFNEEECIPCRIGAQPISHDEAAALAAEVPQWTLHEQSIERTLTFKDFREAMDFVNRVADLAEEQGHHPDLEISYNRVRLLLTTHKAGGLTRNDFILAAKIDKLEKE